MTKIQIENPQMKEKITAMQKKTSLLFALNAGKQFRKR